MRLIAEAADGRVFLQQFTKFGSNYHHAARGDAKLVPDWYIDEDEPVSGYKIRNKLYSKYNNKPLTHKELYERYSGTTIIPAKEKTPFEKLFAGVTGVWTGALGIAPPPPSISPAAFLPPLVIERSPPILRTDRRDRDDRDDGGATGPVLPIGEGEEEDELAAFFAEELSKYSGALKEEGEGQEEEEEVKQKPTHGLKRTPSPTTQEEDPASVATVERLKMDSDDEEVKPGPVPKKGKKASPPPTYTPAAAKEKSKSPAPTAATPAPAATPGPTLDPAATLDLPTYEESESGGIKIHLIEQLKKIEKETDAKTLEGVLNRLGVQLSAGSKSADRIRTEVKKVLIKHAADRLKIKINELAPEVYYHVAPSDTSGKTRVSMAPKTIAAVTESLNTIQTAYTARDVESYLRSINVQVGAGLKIEELYPLVVNHYIDNVAGKSLSKEILAKLDIPKYREYYFRRALEVKRGANKKKKFI